MLRILGLALLLTGCAERYYLPTVINPVALESAGELTLSGGLGLLGPLPVNGADVQVAYSPLPHLGVGLSGTYYHPFDDRRWKAGGDVFVGGYGKIGRHLQWTLYGLAGRMHAYYKPEFLQPFLGFGSEVDAPQGAEDGYVDLIFNRYALWPSLRFTDAANMSAQLGVRLNVLGIEQIRLTGPLRASEVEDHRRFGRETPFYFPEFCGTFQLNRYGPHRFTLTGILTVPEVFPTGSVTLTVGYTYRLGARSDRPERPSRYRNARRKRLE
jgi:hypothetical protein